MPNVIEYLKQTLSSSFKIGAANVVQLINNSGLFEMRNADGSALVVVRAADPVGDTDVATKGWTNTSLNGLVGNAVREWEVPVGHADLGAATDTVVDSPNIPSGGVVKSVDFVVTEAFNGGSTVVVGTAADDDVFIAAGVIDLTLVGVVQSVDLRSAEFGSAGPVKFKFTTTGDPDAGDLDAYVTFSVPATS